MSTLLVDLEAYIVAGGLATADGTDIFRENAPTTPDTCTILYEYAGIPGGKGDESQLRSIQVVARSKSVATAQTNINALFALLNKPNESVTMLTSTRWAILSPRQTPFKMDVDANGRTAYAFNLGVTTKQD